MAQDADNDNATRSVVDAIRAAAPDLTSYGPGGTALAADAAVDPTRNVAIEAMAQHDAAPASLPEMSGGGGDDENASAVGPQIQSSAPVAQQPPVEDSESSQYAVTEATPLAELGIELPQLPAAHRATRQAALEKHQSSAPAAAPRRRPAGPTVGGQGSTNAHLFNTPPAAETRSRADAFADAAFAADAQAPSRRAMTNQPGFVVGLASAAIAGAGLYLYLV